MLLRTEFDERNAEIPPDGSWPAYESNASGQFEVYVRPFPDVDSGRWQVSTEGGVTPLRAPDGRELFYVAPVGGPMMAVTVQTDATFALGNPEVLFEENYHFGGLGRNYDIAPDGRRFLMIKAGGGSDGTGAAPSIIVVENWLDELARPARARAVILNGVEELTARGPPHRSIRSAAGPVEWWDEPPGSARTTATAGLPRTW